MRSNLRSRIAIPHILLIIIAFLVLTITISLLLRNTFIDIYQQKLLDECSLISEIVAERIHGSEPSILLDDLARKYSNKINARVTLIDPKGVVLGDSETGMSDMDNHYFRPEVYKAFQTGQGSDLRYSTSLDQNFIYSASQILYEGEVVGIVRLSIPETTFNASLQSVTRVVVIFTAILIGVSIVTSFLISANFLNPLRELHEKIEEIGEGNFGHYLIHTRSPELLEMNRALNRMGEKFSEQLITIVSEKNRLSVVLEQMADGALITDHLGLIQYINPAAIQLLNAENMNHIGYTFAEVVRHHQIIDLWRKCLESNEQQGALIETTGEMGRFLQVIITPYSEVQERGYLLILQDLTELRRLETIRRDFISNISHDLRTPISSLQLMTETLQNGAINDPDVAGRFLTLMGESIETMSQLVEELLELSLTESGRVPLQMKPTPLVSIIEPAIERLRPQAERSRLTLSYNFPRNLPMVMVDYERVTSVITNLIHNAIKFTLPGGEITVSAKRFQQEVIVSVKDTGIGIPKEDADDIFERFYKVDRARTSKGMGLGLSIAKTVIEGHGGRIWVESEPEVGSTFYFSLPIVKSTPLAKA